MDDHHKNQNILAALTSAILLVGVECVLLFGAIVSFFPRNLSALLPDVFPKDLHIIKGDWKMWVYHAVIAICIIMACLAVTRCKDMFLKQGAVKHLKLFCLTSAVFIFLEVFSAFFILTNTGNQWAWILLVLSLLSSVICKIFFPELQKFFFASVLNQKLSILAGVVIVVLFLMFTAPGAVMGQFLLWLLVIATCVVIIGGSVRLGFFKNVKYPLWLRGIADQIVWLCGNQALTHIGFMAGGMLIVALLWIADPLAVLAKTAFGEHYYHFDFMLMASAYAASVGNILGVDHNVFYGLGMPIFVSALAKLLGGVNYLNVFQAYWALTVLYYVVFYVCLRFWLGSVLLALGATLLAIKWQVFYSLSYPVSAIYPNSSPLRCFFDIPILMLLYAHLKNGRLSFVALAAAGIGGAIFFMPTTGIDVYTAFLAYVLVITVFPIFKYAKITWMRAVFLLALPIISAFVFFFLFCGPSVLGQRFWQDLIAYPSLFANGFYDIWFWDSLLHGYYVDFAMGCVFPLLYLGTLLWIGLRLYFHEAKKQELITLVICAYGLSLYHHYLVLSLQNNYYMRAIVFVWVVFYWVQFFFNNISSRKRAICAWGIAVLSVFMLLANHLYKAFPNYLNRLNVRNPMVDRRTAYGLPEDGRPYFFHQEAWIPEEKKLKANSLGTKDERMFFEWQVPNHDVLKALYAQEFNFSDDARLIASLTSPQEKVALLSSFEIELLIQAKRRPYFFYLPIISSRGLNGRTFPHTNIYTRRMLKRTLDDLSKDKPTYIFMEKIFLNKDYPAGYGVEHEEILGIMEYILKHYDASTQGRYLVAMKRNDI